MRFAISAYSCVYPISAYSREEALNRLIAFNKERRVAATVYVAVEKRAYNLACVSKSGEVRHLSGWDEFKKASTSPSHPESEPEESPSEP